MSLLTVILDITLSLDFDTQDQVNIDDSKKDIPETSSKERKSFAQRHASKLTEMLSGNPDGEKLTAAFVSFDSLNATMFPIKAGMKLADNDQGRVART